MENILIADKSHGTLIIIEDARWRACARLLTSLNKYNIVIVTNYQTEIMEIYNKTHDTEWSDLELVAFPFFSYYNLHQINLHITNAETDFIVFDDARSLSAIINVLHLDKLRPKLLVLSNHSNNTDILDVVTGSLNSWSLLGLRSKYRCLGNKKVVWTRNIAEGQYIINRSQSYESIMSTLNRFNTSEHGTLVTEVIPFTILKGVAEVHFLDSYSSNTIVALTDKLDDRDIRIYTR